MAKFFRYIIIIAVVALLVALVYYSLPKTKSNIKELASIQVTEYEGQDLSSITGFRENSIKGPQYVDRDSYNLKISGLTKDVSYSYDDAINKHQSYKKVVTLNCVEGWSVKILWEGVLVRDLVDIKQIPESANTVIFHAYDGYTTSFPIEYIMDNDIIMAYKMNGVELPPERGFPFHLVAESKWGYKWIKWITEIEFSDDENYQGYWERRGYSDTGDLEKSFFNF